MPKNAWSRSEAAVRSFGAQWSAFDQSALGDAEYQELFDRYFGNFPWNDLPPDAEGFDLGCGSGRWAEGVAQRVGKLHCIDPAEEALAAARRRLARFANVEFQADTVDSISLADGSQDFGYCLGVLHHVPDTLAALQACARKLKAGAPLLVYLYYRFENRPRWFVAIWKASDLLRRVISRLPFPVRRRITDFIAATIYWPLARTAALLENCTVNVSNLPLSAYRHLSFYTMRTDALDRFGTFIELRFTRSEIHKMMIRAGLEQVRFNPTEPFWVACGWKGARSAGEHNGGRAKC